MTLGVRILDRETLAPLVLDGSLRFDVESVEAGIDGGPLAAEIAVTGAAASVADALRWLRCGVEVYGGFGSLVWEGYVHEVDVTAGGWRYRAGLGDVGNRIKILYDYENVDGDVISGETLWGDELFSQGLFGVIERRVTASDTEEAGALALRARWLAEMSKASAEVEPGGGGPVAMLYCKGWFSTLEWRYCLNDTGRVEHQAENEIHYPMGLGFQSTGVGFDSRRIYEIYGLLQHFDERAPFDVTGAASNNGTFTPTGSASAESPDSYTSVTIRLEPDDDVKDTLSGLGFMRAPEMIQIIGSTYSDGWWRTDSANPGVATLYTGWSGTTITTAEGPGTSITILQGTSVPFAESGTNERPDQNGTVTVTSWGYSFYQKFSIPQSAEEGGWTAHRIGVMLQAVGDPTDSILVNLNAVSGAGSGTVLASGLIPASAVGSEMGWVWCDLATPVDLEPETDYIIFMRRYTYISDPENFYRVGLDADGSYEGGPLYVAGAGTWIESDYSLQFRVWAMIDTAELIGELADQGEFVRSIIVDGESGVTRNSYRDGEQTIADEVLDLAAVGTDSGGAMVVRMLPGRALRVLPAPTDERPTVVWGADGTLRPAAGGMLEPGALPVGQWCAIDAILPVADSGIAARFSPRLIARARYKAGRWELDFAGRRDLLDLGAVQR